MACEHAQAAGRPPAFLFGDDVGGLAVLRSLGRSGITVFSAATLPRLISGSRWYRPSPGGTLSESPDGARLARYLDAQPFGGVVIFPCSDQWTLAAASLPKTVARRHQAVAPSLGALRTLVDKVLFAEVAALHRVPVPRTLEAIDPASVDLVEPSELGGYFLKPRNSQLFAKRFGVKGFRLTDPRQASDLVDRILADGHEPVLQEYIPGPPTEHVFLDGYVDRAGAMRVCLARRRLRMFPRTLGSTTLTVTIPLSDAAAAVADLRRLLDGIAFTGLFDAEFKRDARDGRFKILAVNGRPWWQLGLWEAAGLGLCEMAYRDALGLPFHVPQRYRVGCRWVNPIPDLRSWWAGRSAGDAVGGSPARAWLGAVNAVFSRDDPRPSLELFERLPRELRVARREPSPPRGRQESSDPVVSVPG